jgi:hypothetical protein
MAIRFLSNIEKWKDFSNLAPYPIYIEGENWKSTEHYYQYKKFEKVDLEFAIKLKNLESPKEVKKLSLQNNNFPKNWKDIKVEILKYAIFKKFERYENLQKLLISTGKEILIEANVEDYFWGEGADGSGKNMMGKILMEVRLNLQNKVH